MRSNAKYYLPQYNSCPLNSPSSIQSTASMPSMRSAYSHTPIENINPVQHVHPAKVFQNKSETDDYINPNDEFEIRVQGIPSTGAKSRVETQIKLSIQLMSKSGIKTPYWSYLRINESMLAKSKLRKTQQQKLLDGSAAAMVSDESKVLDLEARVVCETDENKIIKMCQGCVRRERKRAERKKDAKPFNYKLNSNVVDKQFERDSQRVLLFNCESLVNFSTGEATLPTRITCYCRHHSERIGFRVRFIVKNHRGVIVATGDTPPVMITDDHKSSKQSIPLPIEDYCSRKRRRATSSNYEEESDVLTTPASSRRNSFSGSENESDKNPLLLNYASPSSSPNILHHFSVSSNPNPSEITTLNYNSSNNVSSPQTPNTPNLCQNNVISENPYDQFQLPSSKTLSSHHYSATQTMTSHPIMLQENEFDEHQVLPPTRRRRRLENFISSDKVIFPLTTVNDTYHQQEMHEITLLYDQSYSAASITTNMPVLPSLIPSNEPDYYQPHPIIPILNTITPSEGHTYGGIEISIEGEGFHNGLILMFGDRAATTVYCSPTSMVCILPPAEQSGTVLVSFKEHSLMRASELPPLFNYYEQSKHNLIGFSLQAVGLKNNQHHASNPPFDTATRRHIKTSNSPLNYAFQQEVESEIIHILSQHCYNFSSLTQSNMGGQNLLHFAAYFNMSSLIEFLVLRNPNLVHSQDRNGLTPLHFSCQKKSTAAITALLKSGANIANISSIGSALGLVAKLLDPVELQYLETQIQRGGSMLDIESSNSVEWLPSLFIYAAIQYYQTNNVTTTTIEPCVNFFLSQQSNIVPVQQHESDALYYQQLS